ncbi:MHS family MFS transporter [Amycolatopsis sp. K13G38]|uniref:MHS family MFS transporter n=1 Tax=Amycolatopsis acididurans TaxID=2724524 RepID=A0ABX1JB34_9PSEU|nr:MFS transporter [Amycolatopsis acididurans]NKQ55492.1 MHS family MFS transporter [Amycolatopsis acididurans]
MLRNDISRTDGRRRVLAAGAGNFMEWFDFSVYGFFAGAIGANFFPSASATSSLLSTLAVYGVAFLMRPVGGFVLGAVGDRRGRRFALTLSVVLMGVSTALIAALPSYAHLGVAAPVLLVLLRCVQGFSAGGEWTGSAAFLVESAAAHRRGRTASVVPATAALAVAAGALSALVIRVTVPSPEIVTWGWRIPFLVAFPLTLVGLYLRMKLEDTEVFRELKARGAVAEAPIRAVGRGNAKSVAISCALSAITVLGFYYIAAYSTTFLTTTARMAPRSALVVVAVGALIYAACCPLAGILSDRFGRRPVSLAGGAGLAVCAVPAFLLMGTGSPVPAVAGMVLFGLFEALHNTTTTVMLTELFPAHMRSTGSAIGYNIGAALIAGPGPLIAAALATAGAGLPAVYIAGVAFVCTVVLWFALPETRWRALGPDPRTAAAGRPITSA